MALPNTNPTYQYIGGAFEDGIVVAKLSTQPLGFWGATPIAKGSTALATVAATAAVISSSASAWCYNSSAQADGIVTALNLVVRTLVSVGLSS